MKLDKPNENGEGEICFRGRHVFMGYLNDEEKTKEAIDEEGWLHSGDIGRVDQDGEFKFLLSSLRFITWYTLTNKNTKMVTLFKHIRELSSQYLVNVMLNVFC